MRIVVIGAGASGIFCSGLLAHKGYETILLDQNERVGKKLYITGKGRCNLTNACDTTEFLDNVVTNKKFLYGPINKFGPYDIIDWITNQGLDIKIERGNRVFPSSDKANDVINVLENFARNNGVSIKLNTKVDKILIKDKRVFGIIANGKKIECDKVVVATGGKSYTSTGSTGDGFKFAKEVGHNILELKPALVPIILNGVDGLAGLSLKNVAVSILNSNGKEIYSNFGEMLFTHNGVSGPIILSLSSLFNKHIHNGQLDDKYMLSIDLKPALTHEMLDNRILRDFEDKKNSEIKNVLSGLMPKSLIPIVLSKSHISGKLFVNAITKEQRISLVNNIKSLKFSIINLDNIDFAIVTSGGVDVKEINPKDMQSKIIKGLYFIGEVLDVDALTGGFNITIAMTTAYSMANSLN